MKFYDKEMAKREVYIKNIVFMIVIFTIGVAVGFFAAKIEIKPEEKPQNKIVIQEGNTISKQ